MAKTPTDHGRTSQVPEESGSTAWPDPMPSALQYTPGLEATYLARLPLGLETGDLLGAPMTVERPSDYVLPNGVWWMGPYVGIGAISGQWRGEDVAALRAAERWRGTTQAGFLLGREWRTNWGVSAGLGLSRVRSTFHARTPGEPTVVTDVDTSWVETNHIPTGLAVYTWMIDSLVAEVPGETVRSDARNVYTAIQVPITLHWHTTLRRLRLGAMGGITAWIPTQRKGLTLVQLETDAAPTPLALQDARVNERFSTQLHGHMGLSMGYVITEQFTVFAEPMISAPMLSFDGRNTPWLTRPVLQLRLQHEFR
jgi:hypothetical protein